MKMKKNNRYYKNSKYNLYTQEINWEFYSNATVICTEIWSEGWKTT